LDADNTYQKAKLARNDKMKIAVISFTENGKKLGEKIKKNLIMR